MVTQLVQLCSYFGSPTTVCVYIYNYISCVFSQLSILLLLYTAFGYIPFYIFYLIDPVIYHYLIITIIIIVVIYN